MKECIAKSIDLCGEWDFLKGEAMMYKERPDQSVFYTMTKAGYQLGSDTACFPANPWTKVTVPHDWQADEIPDKKGFSTFGYKNYGVAWYKKEIVIPAEGHEKVILEFEGVMSQATVYVNETLAGRSFSGYAGFSMDISDLIVYGEVNRIALRVEMMRNEGWWYEGAGIYRPVTIHMLPKTHFEENGIFIHTTGLNENAVAAVEVELISPTDSTLELEIGGFAKEKCKISASEDTQKLIFEIPIPNAPVWSVETPNMLELKATITSEDSYEEQIIPFGVREIQWDNEKGFILNGKATKLKGICCHHDHAGLGIAVPYAVTEYRIKKLKEMGCNAYRLGHHCPSKDLLDICDKLGMLVMSENRHFTTAEEVLKQVDTMVYVSRNHPCVFIYSAFNEEWWAREVRGKRIMKTLYNRIKKNDKTRYITGAIHARDGMLTPENASDSMDITGINYLLDNHDEARKRLPNQLTIATESCPTRATRGVYESSEEKQVFASIGEFAFGEWNTMEYTMQEVFARPFITGCFVWSGFDYRGESTPYEWPSIWGCWGLYDMCGFPKDTAYQLKSYYSDETVLHLCNYWDFDEGKDVKVTVFSNLPEVKIYLNDKPMGTIKIKDCRGEMTIPFAEGTLRAEGTKDGKIIVDELKTPETPYEMNTAITQDADIAIVDISVEDGNGTFVNNFNEALSVQLKNCEVISIGNGDPNFATDEKGHSIPFFNGMAQVILRKSDNAEITLFCGNLTETQKTIKL